MGGTNNRDILRIGRAYGKGKLGYGFGYYGVHVWLYPYEILVISKCFLFLREQNN